MVDLMFKAVFEKRFPGFLNIKGFFDLKEMRLMISIKDFFNQFIHNVKDLGISGSFLGACRLEKV